MCSRRAASAFLLDSKGRLWIGADNGERGGWCSCFDTRTGRLRSIPGLQIYQMSQQRSWLGICGFTELDDGQVWAFGGTIHFTQSEGFIWRVDQGTAEQLYRSGPTPPGTKPVDPSAPGRAEQERIATGEGGMRGGSTARPPGERASDAVGSGADRADRLAARPPRLPITQVLPDKRSAGFIIIALKDALTATRDLTRWSKFASIPAHIGGNRIDSGGPAAPVKQVLRVRKNNGADDLILVTSADGLIKLSGGKATLHALPGQIGVNRVRRIENSCAGVLVFGEPSEPGGPWQYKDGRWRSTSSAPPFGAADGDGLPAPLARYQSWEDTQTLIGPGGEIITVSRRPRSSSRAENRTLV